MEVRGKEWRDAVPYDVTGGGRVGGAGTGGGGPGRGGPGGGGPAGRKGGAGWSLVLNS